MGARGTAGQRPWRWPQEQRGDVPAGGLGEDHAHGSGRNEVPWDETLPAGRPHSQLRRQAAGPAPTPADTQRAGGDTDRADAQALGEAVVSCDVLTQLPDRPLPQAAAMVPLVQVEDGCGTRVSAGSLPCRLSVLLAPLDLTPYAVRPPHLGAAHLAAASGVLSTQQPPAGPGCRLRGELPQGDGAWGPCLPFPREGMAHEGPQLEVGAQLVPRIRTGQAPSPRDPNDRRGHWSSRQGQLTGKTPTVHHTEQPAVRRVQVVGGHIVPLRRPVYAGVVLHVELLGVRPQHRIAGCPPSTPHPLFSSRTGGLGRHPSHLAQASLGSHVEKAGPTPIPGPCAGHSKRQASRASRAALTWRRLRTRGSSSALSRVA